MLPQPLQLVLSIGFKLFEIIPLYPHDPTSPEMGMSEFREKDPMA